MKIDIFRFIEMIAVLLFGFVGYLWKIHEWTKDSVLTIVFGVLFFVILFMAGIGYKYVNDWIKGIKDDKKSIGGGRKNA